MCFMAVYLLREAIDSYLLARILERLGYNVRVRRSGVVEAYLVDREIVARVEGDRVSLESSDYGEECLRDLEDIVYELKRKGLRPKLLVIKSPYIFGLEKKRGVTKKFLKRLGLDVSEEYSGYCG